MASQPVLCKLVSGMAATSSITKGKRPTARGDEDGDGPGRAPVCSSALQGRDGRWQMAAGNPGRRLDGLGGLVGWVGERGDGGATRWEWNNEEHHCLLQPVRST